MSELASFHDVLFPTAVSFGATGGPERTRWAVISISPPAVVSRIAARSAATASTFTTGVRARRGW